MLSKDALISFYLSKLGTLLNKAEIDTQFNNLFEEYKPFILLQIYQNFFRIAMAPNKEMNNFDEVKKLSSLLQVFNIKKVPEEIVECLKDFHQAILNVLIQ